MMTADSMLEVQGFTKSFAAAKLYQLAAGPAAPMTRRLVGAQELDRREFWALRVVSFTVGRGEAFGIRRERRGKSHHPQAAHRIMQPTAGTIRAAVRISALIEVGAAFTRTLPVARTLPDGAILGMTRNEITTALRCHSRLLGARGFHRYSGQGYSSGMYARLGFSVAAHVDPES